MHQYTELVHKSVLRKVCKLSSTKRILSVRLGSDREVNIHALSLLSDLSCEGFLAAVATKGRTSLPSYCLVSGDEVMDMLDEATRSAGKAVITVELRSLKGG